MMMNETIKHTANDTWTPNVAYQMFEAGTVPTDNLRDMFETDGFPEAEALYAWLRDATAGLGIQEHRLAGSERPYAVSGNYWRAELTGTGSLERLRVTNRAGQSLIWNRGRGWEIEGQ